MIRPTGIPSACVAAALTAGCTEVPRTYSTKAGRGTEVFRDDFGRDELGPEWAPSGPGAALEAGSLRVENLRNHPLWLVPALPDDFRVDFEAWSEGEDGDIKVELCGDGRSHATTPNYVATGYSLIFGGWDNRLNVIARNNEHGRDRKQATEPKVEPGRHYHFTLTRKDGELRWELDGEEILTFDDPEPLRGTGHDHFAFGGWETIVRFDNLVVEAL